MAIPDKKNLEFNCWRPFLFLLLLYLISAFYSNHFIVTKDIFHSSLSSQLSYRRIDQLFSMRQRWEWAGFFLLPLILLLRISITSACLAIGCYLSDIKIPYKDLFRITLVAEICLATGMVVRIVWLTFMSVNTLTDIQYFSPLSLAQLLRPKTIPKYLLYLFQTINVFEIAYWIVLAAGLATFLQKPFYKMLKLVMSSYGIGLLLWIIFVSYLTVTLSP